MINRFGHVSFRTGYAAMRCFKSRCFNDLKLANLFDDQGIEQVLSRIDVRPSH